MPRRNPQKSRARQSRAMIGSTVRSLKRVGSVKVGSKTDKAISKTKRAVKKVINYIPNKIEKVDRLKQERHRKQIERAKGIYQY